MVKYAQKFYLLFTIYYVVKKWVVKVIRRYKRAYFRTNERIKEKSIREVITCPVRPKTSVIKI